MAAKSSARAESSHIALRPILAQIQRQHRRRQVPPLLHAFAMNHERCPAGLTRTGQAEGTLHGAGANLFYSRRVDEGVDEGGVQPDESC